MFFNDAFTDGKAYAGTLVVVIFMKALEYLKDPILVFGVEANAVIGNGHMAVIGIRQKILIIQLTSTQRFAFYKDTNRPFGMCKFERIANKVLQQLPELEADTAYLAKAPCIYGCLFLLDSFPEFANYLLRNFIEICFFESKCGILNPRVGEQVFNQHLHALNGFLHSLQIILTGTG